MQNTTATNLTENIAAGTRRVFLSRRAVLGGAAAALAGMGLAGCGVNAPADSDAGSAPSDDTEQTGGADWGQDGVMRIGMEAAYPPFNWQEDEASDTNIPIENVDGAYAEGYDVQIARRVCDELGLDPVAVKMEFTGLISALNGGQIDMIIAGMADTEERKESIAFSDPYQVEDYGLMVLRDSEYADATTLEDFSGASVLGQSQTSLDTVIDQIPGVNHVTPVDNTSDMLARLTNGTVDAITVNVPSGQGYMDSNPDLVMITFPQGEGFDLGYTGSCVGLRKEDTDLLELVNDALATISDDERNELMDEAVANQPAA